MSDTCVKHSFETAAGVCRQCRNSYCTECLVFAFGEKKPPYCVTCALMVAGVRHHGAKPNPRLRKRGFFGRKVIVEEEPRVEMGFDDIKIELPEVAAPSPVMTRTTRRDVAPEVLAMVQSSDSDLDYEFDDSVDGDAGGVAVAAPPSESSDSLADWAASLDPVEGVSDAGTSDPWQESSGLDAWPDDATGRKY